MRRSVKGSTIFMPRLTKASLAHRSKIRNSVFISSKIITNTLKSIQNQHIKFDPDVRRKPLMKRTGIISKHITLFKRRKSLNKLSAIISNSSLDNSGNVRKTLKQVIVGTLAENVKNINIILSGDKENDLLKYMKIVRKSSIPKIDHYPVEQIEPPYTNELYENEEPIDPLYAMDYITDIMNLLYALEKRSPIRSSFLTNSLSTMVNGGALRAWKLAAKHRTIVVGWVLHLCYAKFHLSQDTMHSCINLLDRFLQKSMTSINETDEYITENNLKLIAVATFLIATKFEETYHPPVDELAYVTDHTYSDEQIKQMERTILYELNFELNYPSSLQFLRRFSFITSASDEQHAIGKFLIDMSLLDVSCMDLSPSLVAASATYIARYILNRNQSSRFEEYWPYDLQIRSPYKTLQSLSKGIQILARCIDNYLSGNSFKEHEILIKRYEHEQLSRASLYCIQQRTLIHELAYEF